MTTYVIYPAPDMRKEFRFGYSVSCLTVATIAKSIGEVRYFDFSLENKTNDAESLLLTEVAHAVGPTTCVVYFDSVPLHRSGNVSSARHLCTLLRQSQPDARIIACGPYCMIRKTHESCADITIVSEPEYLLEMVLKGGIHDGCLTTTKNSGAYVRLIEDLDTLPLPDRSFLPHGCETPLTADGTQRLARSAVVSTTRGCLGSCRFCPRGSWNLHRVRHRSVEIVMSEISQLLRQGYRNIWFDDENMGIDVEWTTHLFDEIAEINVGKQCAFCLSPWGRVPEVFFERAFRAGVRIVSFGVESGSDSVLRFFGKPVTVDSLAESLSCADKHGLFTVGNIIIGAPCETTEDLDKTLDFQKRVPVDQVNIKILSYIYGAPLWFSAVERGLLQESEECVFADGNRGLSNRSFEVLVTQQERMKNIISEDLNRRFRLDVKLARYGLPYILEACETDQCQFTLKG